jgi:3-oxoacyl-[acyl-carrier protein] reductase
MKRAIITGGSGGLGNAIADELRSHGWQVEALGRKNLDLRDEAAITAYFRHREADLLVCAAGMTHDVPLARLDDAAWDETYSVNFRAARQSAEAVLPRMAERGHGHIVFISSQSAIHPPVGQAAYATAKAALLGLTTDLAHRHGSANIRINTVLPGFLETPMTHSVSEKRRREVLAAHHLGRFNTPGAVAAFIRFLHDEHPHTSGQVLRLDSRGS